MTADLNHPIYRVIALAILLVFLGFVSWLNASNFDQTELKMIVQWSIGALALLFAPEFLKRFLK